MSIIRVGVIGHPISHSKSPLIHNEWIRNYKFNGEYKAHDIDPKKLKKGVQDLIDMGYRGFNVTIPHKETIIDLCESIDDKAHKIGAVNTIVIKDEKLYGSNTDAFGFIESIKHKYPYIDFTKGKAVVLGAGGAARAVVYGLLQNKVPKILIANRTKEKAENLAQSMAENISGQAGAQFSDIIEIVDWEDKDKSLKEANLVINTTSLGMTGQPLLELDLWHLPQQAYVVDLVYAPRHTDLIRSAMKNKNPYIVGSGMLIHQARLSFQSWFGVLPTVTKEFEQKVGQ